MKVTNALAAGNTVVLKPSPLTPLAGLALARIIDQHTDIPPGVVNVVTPSGVDASKRAHHGSGEADHVDCGSEGSTLLASTPPSLTTSTSTRRNVGVLVDDSGERKTGKRCQRRRLENDGVACRQRIGHLHDVEAVGKFHGVSTATTPNGSWRSSVVPAAPYASIGSSVNCAASSPACSAMKAGPSTWISRSLAMDHSA